MDEPAPDEPVADPEMQRAGRLIQQGRLAEAEAVLHQVMVQRPDAPDPWFAAGVICLNTNRLAEAAAKFHRAVELDPDFAEAHNNIGIILGLEGKLHEAEAAFERAVAMDPGLTDAQRRLGALLLARGKRTEATASFRRAALAAEGSPAGVLAEAMALEAEKRLPEAEVLLRGLIATAPTSDAVAACCRLAAVLRQRGLLEEAVAWYDRASALSPGDPDTYYGRVTTAKMVATDRPLIDSMLALLDEAVSSGARMTLHFALGKAFDDLGDYAAAMRQFDAANAIRRRGAPLDRPRVAAWIDRLRGSETFARTAPSGRGGQTPVLIVGLPRSGTTLLEQILSSHPCVAAGGELNFWGEQGPAWSRALPGGIGVEHTTRLADEYGAILANIAPHALRVTDKNPWNYQWIGLIRQTIPNARFIHCRRNPVDTCLSIYFTRFTAAQNFMSDRGDLVFFYRQYERLMDHWRRTLPAGRYTEVQYETLVTDREAETRRVVAFCGLEWDDACLDHQANTQPVATASSWQVRQPVYRDSVERWRRYEPWLGELRELLSPAWTIGA